MFGKIDLPEITCENFEDHLTSDDIMIDFFNEFLHFSSFVESISYNRETGGFEVVSDAADSLSRQIDTSLRELRAQLLSSSLNPCISVIDNSYTVICLDREQGVQWVKRERLHFFLQSDCYFEYRLAKGLSQLDISLAKQRQGLDGFTSLATPLQGDGGTGISSGHSSAQLELQKSSTSTNKNESNRGPVHLYVTEAAGGERDGSPPVLNDPSLDPSAPSMVTHSLTAGAKEPAWRREEADAGSSPAPAGGGAHQPPAPRGGALASSPPAEDDHSSRVHDTRQGLEAFKTFLQGTKGQRLLCLWMDIERLKTLQNRKSVKRHLVKMTNQYLFTGGGSTLNEEFLSRLGLASSPCWRKEKLLHAQPCLTEALLLYWGQQFLLARRAGRESCASRLRLGWGQRLWPPRGGVPCPRYISLHPLSAKPHMPTAASPSTATRAPTSACHRHTNSAELKMEGRMGSPVLEGRRMERMLQALQAGSRGGFIFRHFCQHSGNQLWENAFDFWEDLQEYHLLFYQDGLDPYRVKRKAQLLYSTYLSTAARWSVRVDEESVGQVFARLSLPFEELFDRAEEHALTLLMEPWTRLTKKDRETYDKVDLWEQTRRVNSVHYAELMELCTEVMRTLQQQVQEGKLPAPPAEGTRETDLWALVPDQFKGFRLGTILHNQTELHHFHAFLEQNFASMDLMCWLNIEELKRTSQQDQALEERDSNVKSKYLSKRYFFGTNSPASKEQQEEVLRLAGGRSRLLQEPLQDHVLSAVQRLISWRMEGKWLPLFLASAEFAERQKLKAEVADVVEDQLLLRQRKKRRVWKHVEGPLMSSSNEVLALRRALGNPVTCLQFQRFISLRGPLLENGLLFWLEVQRYKELCHSHSDEAMVQHKVTTIINCFINSSIPPMLQIDIPSEMAQSILDKRGELGPYIFREAQMCVFSELLKLWPEFVEFRNSVDEGQILAMLQSQKERQKERRRRRASAKKEQQDELESQTLREGILEKVSNRLCEYTQEDGQNIERTAEWTYPTQTLSWSYSKYMAGLEREQTLIRLQGQQLEAGGASFATVSESTSVCSLRSKASKPNGCPWPVSSTHAPQRPVCTSRMHTSALASGR